MNTNNTSAFQERIVIITGAGSGIGKHLSMVLAAEGARIGAIDCSAEGLDSLAGELEGKTWARAVADVTDLQAMQSAIRQLESELGPTDILVANAGIGRETPASKFDADLINLHFRVNLEGVINSFAAVLPGMQIRRQGHLVALSSLASYHGLPLMSAYCASKAAVSSMMDSLRVELKPMGIACTTLCPGWIRTPLTRKGKLSRLKMMELNDAVGTMVKIIRNRRAYAAFPAGNLVRVCLLRYLPRSWSDWLVTRFLGRLPQ